MLRWNCANGLGVPSSKTPTFFEIVRKTLDRGYADIKGERDEKIKALSACGSAWRCQCSSIAGHVGKRGNSNPDLLSHSRLEQRA
jgi:hypothetical protein